MVKKMLQRSRNGQPRTPCGGNSDLLWWQFMTASRLRWPLTPVT